MVDLSRPGNYISVDFAIVDTPYFHSLPIIEKFILIIVKIAHPWF
jgi:hypothetical protein